MNLQGRNLSIDMQGDDVRLLHTELLKLGFGIPVAEQRKALFGEGTRNAVLKFQESNRLTPTGEVDERTAKIINARVDELHPAPIPADGQNSLIVRGLVSTSDGVLPAGVIVRAFDKDMRSAELLGETHTDSLGNYEIRYSAERFNRAEKGTADLIVRAFDDHDQEIGASSPLITFNAQPIETVNLSVVIEGMTRSEFERLIEQLRPVVQDVALNELTEEDIDFLVGDTGIDRQLIEWLVEATRVGLEVSIPDRSAWTTSHVLPQPPQGNAAVVMVLYGWFRQSLPNDLTELLGLDQDILRGAIERSVRDNIIPQLTSEQIENAIRSLRGYQSVVMLKPAAAGEPTSIGDLLRTTELSPEKQVAVAALQLQHGDGTEEFLTALNEQRELNERETESVRSTLKLGQITSGHLPLIAELQRNETRESSVEGLRALAKLEVADWKSILMRPQPDGTPIGAPPETPGKNLEDKVNNYAASLFRQIEDLLPTPVIASRLEKDNSPKSPFASTRADLKIFFDNNPSFEFRDTPVNLYLNEGGNEKLRGVNDPADLTSELLTMQRLFNITPYYAEMRALRDDNLKSSLEIVHMGERTFTNNYAERLGGPNRARDLYNKAEQVHATALSITLKHAAAFNDPLPYAIRGDTSNSNIALSFRSNIPNWSQLFGSLDLCNCEQCQSLYSPAAYFVDILRFLSDGPTKEGLTPLQVLLNRRPDLEHIELTCENTNTQLPYIDLLNEILEADVKPRLFQIPEGQDINAVLADLGALRIPASIKTAFETKGYALTDKASLRLEKVGGMETDLGWIILDGGWAFELRRQGPNEGFRVRAWPQTSWLTNELRANPEHNNEAAYTVLKRAVYPWTLPQNLPLEEMRVYLRRLGIEPHELMETFFRGPSSGILSDNDIAREYLGLSKEEVDIITGLTTGAPAGTTPSGPWNFYGLTEFVNNLVDISDGTANPATGDWDVVLRRVSIFLQQSNLRYAELLELLGTYFINPPNASGVRPIGIASIDPQKQATCVLSELEIRVVDSAIATADQKTKLIEAWNRIHRFVRLWRALGWTTRDLDKAIGALQPQTTNGLSNPFLLQLSHVKRLQARFGLPVVNLLSWWANIDSRSYIDHLTDGEPTVPSLYATLFNNKSAAGQTLGTDPTTLSGTLSQNGAAIAAALQISVDDFTLLKSNPLVIPPSLVADNLSLVNLSTLYRHASFARALKYSIRSYLSLLELIAPNPFDTTAETVRFAEETDKIRASEFKVGDLDYLLRHQFLPASSLAISDDAIALFLSSLRDDLQKIQSENTFVATASDASAATEDANGDLTRTKLAMLNWPTTLIEQIIAVLNGTFTQEVTLNVFPANLVVPEALRNKFSYDAATQRLRFTGIMTSGEANQLTGLQDASTDFNSAVGLLFNGPRTFVSRHMRRFSVPRFETALEVFPANVKIPESLKSRFYYDRAAQKLNFIGVMTESERSVLTKLSAETKYVAAVTALYNAADAATLIATDIFLTTPVPGQNSDVSALFDDPATTVQSRFLLVLKKLLPYLRSTLSERLVIQRVGEYLQLDSTSTRELLTNWINSSTQTASKSIDDFLASTFAESNPNVEVTRKAFEDQFKTLERLYKIALLGRKFNITATQFGWLFEFGPNTWLDLNLLPLAPLAPPATAYSSYRAWSRLVDLFGLSDSLPLGESLLTDVFRTARDTGTQLDTVLQKLSSGVGWDLSSLQLLSGATGFNFPVSAYQDEVALLRLVASFTTMKRLGASANQCLAWTAAGLTDTDSAKRARDIKSLVKGKLDLTEWLDAAKSLQDPLREKQRSALVSYLVTQRAVRGSEDLNNDFLIDVEMSPCMMTTRIKQAISSVQLFVQRCLMNLEPEVSLTSQEADEWAKWRKQYRVWEANRKVLLYAENWIEPELRDDKSQFFEELENELLQGDITKDSAETAFLHYLEKLSEAARLEIVGLYQQVEPAANGAGSGVDRLHVFGRTYATPHVYYYRYRDGQGSWTAWEKVDADIQGNHLIPLIWNRRLYLFWATFTKKQKEQPLTMPGAGQTMAAGKKTWEIQLSWIELKNGKWSAKKQAKPYLSEANHPDPPIDKDESDFTFKSRVDTFFSGDQQLFLDCYGPISVSVSYYDPNAEETLLFSLGKKYIAKQLNTRGEEGDTRGEGADTRGEAASLLLKLNGQSFPQSGLTHVQIIVRRSGNGQQLDTIAPEVGRFTIDNTDEPVTIKDYFLSSAVYDVAAINNSANKVYTVNLKLRTPSVTLVPRVMHFVSFPFDDGQGDIGKPYVMPSPTLLEPLPGTQFINMMLVESNNPSNALGSDMLLKQTPGTFRLLGKHQTYLPKFLPLPFFYQDDLRTFLATSEPANGQAAAKVRFNTFHHPAVHPFIKSLNRLGIDGLLTLNNQRLIDVPVAFNQYQPNTRVDSRLPREDVDFSHDGAYSIYNWELFFHVPFLIACRLSKNQRFEEAYKWFQYIFDPTATESPDKPTDPGPERFWRVKPFYDQALSGIQTLEDLLEEGTELQDQVREWRANPFNPHAIARLRHVAFMKAVVMRTIDNLIAWGDQLFRRSTIESINEATQLYILAAQILGQRPDHIPARAKAKLQTFRTLDDEGVLDSLSNAVVEIENFIPPSVAGNQPQGTLGGAPLTMQFFCITSNDKLLGYWDTVADRLFKIRHCLNIEGQALTLPIFDSPIDPGLLVRATAAGVDIASALSDINVALPNYRFSMIQQKATELCNDVRSLGGALLAALEKRDAEALALLRAAQEIKVTNAVRAVRQKQVDEAQSAREALDKNKEMVTLRRDYYRDIAFMNEWEIASTALAGTALLLQTTEAIALALSGGLHLVPNAKIGAPPSMGATYGGDNAGEAAEKFGLSLGQIAAVMNSGASMAATLGGHWRRFDEWKLQERLATKELEQVDKQIAAADIRKAIAERELINHDLQIENAKEVDEFLRNKFTNRELYDWMVSQIAAVYFQSYQLAYDVAKRAERAYRYELGLRDSNFIQFGYWDSLKKGLLCGERLYHDLKRIEVSYFDQNKREYEITKNISLNILDPISLMKLKETGECFVSLPEALFDIDYPGHYLRRLRSVGITIPCVTGPYAGVSCTLTLQNSSIRHGNTLLANAYPRQADDTRFADNFGSVQSIVTSTGQSDGGLFDANMRDERYLPFEGQGAISTWRIQMPKTFSAFDYNTISDVILHVRYTAREGGDLLRTRATQALQAAVNEFVQREGQQGLTRVFSLRHEFPTEWHSFLNPVEPNEPALDFGVTPDRFPFQFRGRIIRIKSADVWLKFKDINDPLRFNRTANVSTPLGDYISTGSNVINVELKPAAAATAFTLQLNSNPAFLNGLPRGVKDFISDPAGPRILGEWSLKLKDEDTEPTPLSLWSKITTGGTDHWRFKLDLIEDVFIVCRYSI